MAPLIQDDFDLSSHDDVGGFYDTKMYDTAPLHEGAISAATPQMPTVVVPPIKKHVSFDEVVFCHPVIALDDYTPSEIDACWYSNDNMVAMKQNVRAEAHLVDQGLLWEDTRNYKTTIRGLEGKTLEGQRLRREKRLEAYAAVFSEIEFQSEVSFRDDELIADAYFAYSDACALAAATIGATDAIAAKIIYREEAAAAKKQRSRKQRKQPSPTAKAGRRTMKSGFFRMPEPRSC